MKLCDHCEIVFTTRNCPLCEATDQISALQRDCEKLEAAVEALKKAFDE